MWPYCKSVGQVEERGDLLVDLAANEDEIKKAEAWLISWSTPPDIVVVPVVWRGRMVVTVVDINIRANIWVDKIVIDLITYFTRQAEQ